MSSFVRLITATCLTLAATTADARDRPGTPADVRAWATGATTVSVTFTNTASRDELVQFELEMTINGARAAHSHESSLSKTMGWSGTGAAWGQFHGITLQNLTPETQYCFRFWSRVIDTGVQSQAPSGWACTSTPPRAPHAPLDVRAQISGEVLVNTPRLSWNTPDQSDHRAIDRFIVERQSPPGQNRPWLLEKTVRGPAGEQTTSTQLVFAVPGTPIDRGVRHIYRICAENAGGRTCAKPVELTTVIAPIQRRQAETTSKPNYEVATRGSVSERPARVDAAVLQPKPVSIPPGTLDKARSLPAPRVKPEPPPVTETPR
jgi:hypothetical protein